MLQFLSSESSFNLWMIFLVENFAVTALALLFGYAILKGLHKPLKKASANEWLICVATNFINTIITFGGFWLWSHSYIKFGFEFNWRIVTDFLAIFLIMDLFMYVFHYIIHHTFVYAAIHSFHHKYDNPIPIDLFVLHPLETVSFGLLWLTTIAIFNFNVYAVFFYLIVNVGFGIIGHLGTEPFPIKITKIFPINYLGTSTFHHRHHLDIEHNFGFYTNIWDKLFNTYKE